MKKNNFFAAELLIGVILVAILGLILNPTKLLMPNDTLTMLIIGLIVLFFFFAGLIWKEHAKDERDEFHRLSAGRLSFLVGAFSLVVGIITQSLKHDIDPWLIYALSSMVLTKIIARIYSQLKQ